MKSLLSNLPKGRITRWGFLTVLLVAAGTTVAWMNQRHYQLGGGFITSDGAGTLWSSMSMPLDPDGRTAVLRINTLAGSLVDPNATEFTGEQKMISRDTSKWTTVGYVKAQDNPQQITQIWVISGTSKFTGPDSFTFNYTVNVYLPDADADLDGFPDPGTTPVASFPDLTGRGKRVPIQP
jgi:hypothetical protein